METLILLLVFAVAPLFVGYKVMVGKGRSGAAGLALAFFLSWIGVIITLFFTNRFEQEDAREAILAEQQRREMYRDCPKCKEPMRRDASVCPHCRNETPAWEQHYDSWWSQSEDGTWWVLDRGASEWRRSERGPRRSAAEAETTLPAPPPGG